MALSDEMLETVREEIARNKERIVYAGTVSTVDPLTVVFDGSSLAVPCISFSDVTLVEGRRVAVIQVGSDYVVFGGFGNLDTLSMEVLVGGASPIAVDHNLGTTTPNVTVYELSTGDQISPRIDVVDENRFNLKFWIAAPPADGWYVRVTR